MRPEKWDEGEKKEQIQMNYSRALFDFAALFEPLDAAWANVLIIIVRDENTHKQKQNSWKKWFFLCLRKKREEEEGAKKRVVFSQQKCLHIDRKNPTSYNGEVKTGDATTTTMRMKLC